MDWRSPLFGPGDGGTAVDISKTLDRKLAAVECRSQVGEWSRGFMASRLAEVGQKHGYAYAESCRVIRYRH